MQDGPLAHVVVVYLPRESLCSVAHRTEITASCKDDPEAKCSFFILCGWRVALLIGMSRGALIDRLIACSPGLERSGGRGERVWSSSAAQTGEWTRARHGLRVGGGKAAFVTDYQGDFCRRGVWMRRKGEGALAEGRKIYETIGGRALFVWTLVRLGLKVLVFLPLEGLLRRFEATRRVTQRHLAPV